MQAVEEEVPVCRLRVVRHGEAGRLKPDEWVQLEALTGVSYVFPLSCGQFRPGDVVEVRLVERAGTGK